MADEAPEALVNFIYLMTRDLIPPRYTQSVLATVHAMTPPQRAALDPDIRAFAERVARELCYVQTSGSG